MRNSCLLLEHKYSVDVDDTIPLWSRNQRGGQARIRSCSRIIAAIHAEIVTRRHAADSGTHAIRAHRYAKRDRAWVRDAARHNGNGTQLDNERKWMRPPIGGILTCKRTHTVPSIGLMRYCLPSRTCGRLHTHSTTLFSARCLRNTQYVVTIRSQSLLASC